MAAIKPFVFILLGAAVGAAFTYWLFLPPPTPPVPAQPQPSAPHAVYAPRAMNELPGWTDDTLVEALPALKHSCAVAQAQPAGKTTTLGTLVFKNSDLTTACQGVLAAGNDSTALHQAFETAFQAVSVHEGENPNGLFTGYYEASLRGSLTRQGAYQVPLYGVPKNLIAVAIKDFIPASTLDKTNMPANLIGRVVGHELKPYFTRAEIDGAQAIAADSDAIVWVDDAVDAHVLHIQGSGQVTLPDGTMMRVGFAGHNGHQFRGLGRILIDEGVLDRDGASMIAVRDWLKKNPDRAKDLMNQNARYIFFRKIEGDGPIGAQGVALTPGRSLAVDPRIIPLGLPVWLETADPDGKPLRRLVIAQDVGAAITGVVRGDFFWGAGEAAFAQAARMRSPGSYSVFIPKTATSSPKN